MTLKRTQAGLAAVGYYGGNSPFLNWFKIAREPVITRSDGGPLDGKAIFDAGGYLNSSTGDIIPGSNVLTYSCLFWAPPSQFVIDLGCDFSGEPWVVKWDGTGTGTISGLTTGHSINTSVTNQITFTMGTAPTSTHLVLTVTNAADPPHNIRIYQSRYATNVDNGEMFNPDWLAEASKFGTLRWMDGQYINHSDIVNFSQLADESFHRWGMSFGTGDQTAATPFGAKGSMPVSVLARLANDAGTKVHVCLPSKCTDAFVTSFATYMRDNTTQTIIYEYTNEPWNPAFGQATYVNTQGLTIWPEFAGSPWEAGWRWHGYRSAAIMKIIKDIYNDDTRWHGTINTSAVGSAYVLTQQIVGVNYWRQNVLSPANSLAVNELFKSFMPAAYFGSMNDYLINGKNITAITKANPAKVTSDGHGLSTGNRRKFLGISGMTELNDSFHTVTVLNANEFTLDGVNSTGYGTFVADGIAFHMRPEFFDLCDESASQNIDGDPYKYFNQQFAQLCRTGSCAGGTITTTEQHLADYKNVQWPALKTLATANGVEMRQYEGGNHFVANGYLWNLGSTSQYALYLFNSERSQEVADVYAEAQRAAIAFGFKEPSKYLFDGIFTVFGVWAGVNFWPLVANGNTADTSHPVWQAISAVRDGAVSDSYTVSW